MASGLEFSCSCGSLTGRLAQQAIKSGNHLICHCNSCRSGELYKDQPDPLGKGFEVFQTTPDNIRIEIGRDKLACFSFGEKNPLRWYASCCGAPMFNTLRRAKLSFTGINVARLSDAKPLGRVRSVLFIPGSQGKKSHKGGGRMALRLVAMMTAARLSGRWRQTPFFDESGAPVATPHVLSREEKAALPLRG